MEPVSENKLKSVSENEVVYESFTYICSLENKERVKTSAYEWAVKQGIGWDRITEILRHCFSYRLPEVRYSADGATQEIIATFLEDRFRRDVANAAKNTKGLRTQDEALVGIEE